MKTIGIIPARYESSRFPGKPLIDLAGQSMIERVYTNATQSSCFDTIIVATDDQRIFDHCTSKKINVVWTKEEHQSGTERCIEVVHQLLKQEKINTNDWIINIQGDEPLAHWEHFQCIKDLLKTSPVVTLATSLSLQNQNDTNAVKVSIEHSKALLFTRHWDAIPEEYHSTTYKHMGLYGFTVEALLKIETLHTHPKELEERLEQLRWFHNQIPIAVGITQHIALSIDSPNDVKTVLHELYKQKLNLPLDL